MRFEFSKDASDGSVVDRMKESMRRSRMTESWSYGNGSRKDHGSWTPEVGIIGWGGFERCVGGRHQQDLIRD